MNIQWRGPIEDRRVELLNQNYSYSKIAKTLSKEFNITISRHAIKNRCVRDGVVKKELVGEVMEMPQTTMQIVEVNNTPKVPKKTVGTENSQSDFKQLINLINNVNEPVKIETVFTNRLFAESFYTKQDNINPVPRLIKIQKDLYRELTALKPKKILTLSDIHIPFHHTPAIEAAILANKDADMVVLNGDIFDGDAFSKYKNIEGFNIKVEIENVRILLTALSKVFNHIVWVAGNHDVGRFEKFIANNYSDVLKGFANESMDIRKMFAREFPNLYIVPDNWVQIGDVIFAHKNYFSSQSLKTTKVYQETFANMSAHGLIPNTNFRVIIAGHTHKAGSCFDTVTGKNVKLIEQGCLCEIYAYKYKESGRLGWNLGYCTVGFDDNMKAVFNDTNYTTLDEMPSVWRVYEGE